MAYTPPSSPWILQNGITAASAALGAIGGFSASHFEVIDVGSGTKRIKPANITINQTTGAATGAAPAAYENSTNDGGTGHADQWVIFESPGTSNALDKVLNGIFDAGTAIAVNGGYSGNINYYSTVQFFLRVGATGLAGDYIRIDLPEAGGGSDVRIGVGLAGVYTSRKLSSHAITDAHAAQRWRMAAGVEGTTVFVYADNLDDDSQSWSDTYSLVGGDPTAGAIYFPGINNNNHYYTKLEFWTKETIAALSIGYPIPVAAVTSDPATTGFDVTSPDPAGGTVPYGTTELWHSLHHGNLPGDGTMVKVTPDDGSPWFVEALMGRAKHFRTRAIDAVPNQANSLPTAGYVPFWRSADALYFLGDSHTGNRRAYLQAELQTALGVAAITRKGFDQAGADSNGFLTTYHADLLDDIASDLAELSAGGKLWIINLVGFNDLAAGLSATLSVSQCHQLNKDLVDEVGASNVAGIIMAHTFPAMDLDVDNVKSPSPPRIEWDRGPISGDTGRQYILNQLHGTSYLDVPIAVIDQSPYEYLVANVAAYTGDEIHPSTAAYQQMAKLEAYLMAPFIRQILRSETIGGNGGSSSSSGGDDMAFGSGYVTIGPTAGTVAGGRLHYKYEVTAGTLLAYTDMDGNRHEETVAAGDILSTQIKKLEANNDAVMKAFTRARPGTF